MSMEDEHLHLAVPVGAPDNIQGSASAPVTLIEYSDYQCPVCAQAYPVAEMIKRR